MATDQSAITWDAKLYDEKHSFVWKQADSLLDLLAPSEGERILDLGCGTGQLTAKLATRGAAVVGIDSSSQMIAAAREQFPQIRFEVADARNFHSQNALDAVFSNAALHWILEPESVIDCVRRALKSGGRFVAEFGGRGNVQNILSALSRNAAAMGLGPIQSPWYFPGIEEYSELLERHGFQVPFATLFDRPTQLEGADGMRNWIRMFCTEILNVAPAACREEYLCRSEEELRPVLYRDGSWFADYRRLRVVAIRR